MLNISKENNSIRVEATDYSFYPFNGVVTYPSNSVIVVTDKSNMATFKSSTNGDVLFVGNINELTIDGNKVTKDTIVGEFTKIANASASVDAYTKAESDAKLDKKQDKLVAGDNITLTDNPTDGTTTISGSVNGFDIDEDNVVIGLDRTNKYSNIVLIGNAASVNGHYSTAVGYGASSIFDNSTAVGYISMAHGCEGATAIGAFSETDENTPLCITAGVDENNTLIKMIQGSKEGKISIPLADGTQNRMVIQDEINALKTKKQDKLMVLPESGLSITEQPNGYSQIDIKNLYIFDKVIIGADQTHGTGSATVSIGNKAHTELNYGIALGYKANSNGECSTVIGAESKATDNYSTTIGYYSQSSGDGSLAIGFGAVATADNPLCINAGNAYAGDPIIMIQGAKGGKISILAGDGTTNRMVIQDEVNSLKTKKQDKLVAGSNITLTENTTDGTVTIASTGGSGGTVDAYTKAETDEKLAKKQDKLVAGSNITLTENTADGTVTIASTGGSGGGSVNGLVIDENKVTAGLNQTTEIAQPIVAIGNDLTVKGNYSITIGQSPQSNSAHTIVLGSYATVSGENSIAIGNQASTTFMDSIAIGNQASTTGEKSSVLGYHAKAGNYSIAMGQNSKAKDWSIVLGDKANATGDGSIVLGANASATGDIVTALGYNAKADANNPLCITAGKDDNNPSIIMIQGSSAGKISIPAADGTTNRMVLQDEINSLKSEVATLKTQLAELAAKVNGTA